MTCDLYIEGRAAGTVRQEPDGSRIRLIASCPLPGDGVYKAFLTDGRSRLPIGVMMPHGGTMTACRTVSHRELAALSSPVRGEAVQTVRFGTAPTHAAAPPPLTTDPSGTRAGPALQPFEAPPPDTGGWVPETAPASLFAEPSVAALWEGVSGCRKKTDGDDTLLAAVIGCREPFAPVPMFCLGRAETVCGQPCLVFRINGQGYPLPAE